MDVTLEQINKLIKSENKTQMDGIDKLHAAQLVLIKEMLIPIKEDVSEVRKEMYGNGKKGVKRDLYEFITAHDTKEVERSKYYEKMSKYYEKMSNRTKVWISAGGLLITAISVFANVFIKNPQ